MQKEVPLKPDTSSSPTNTHRRKTIQMPIPKLYQVIQQWWKQISPHYKTPQAEKWIEFGKITFRCGIFRDMSDELFETVCTLGWCLLFRTNTNNIFWTPFLWGNFVFCHKLQFGTL